MRSFINNITNDNMLSGVQVFLTMDNRMELSGIEIKRGKNSTDLEVENQFLDLDLETSLSKKNPIYITVDGKGIILKKLESLTDNSALALKQILPTSSLEDFHIQIFQTAKSTQWAAIIRKDRIQEILILFQEADYSVLGISISPLTFHSIAPLVLHENTQAIKINNKRLNFDNKQIQAIEPYQEGMQHMPIQYADIDPTLILPFAGVVSFVLNKDFGLQMEELTENSTEWQHKKLFQFSLLVGLCSLFFILFVNLLIKQYYEKSNNSLQVQLYKNQSSINLLKEQDKKLKGYDQFLSQTNLLGTSKNSYYFDELAKELPEKIVLTELQYNPILKKKSGKKKLDFQQKTIDIKGICPNNNHIIEWINLLNSYDWISSIRGPNLSKSEFEESNNFEVTLTLK